MAETNGQRGMIDVSTLRDAIQGPRLSTNEKYQSFLRDQEWFNKPIQPINVETAPVYYVEMTRDEREIHNIVIEFTNAANFKKTRAIPPTLEVLSKYEGWGGLQTPEVKKLYEVPGVRSALERYIKIYDTDEKMGTRENQKTHKEENFSLRTAKSREQVLKCRENIRKDIKKDVLKGYRQQGKPIENKETLNLKAREAEQIAFTLLYLGNTFESLDSKYNDMGRIRASECMNDLVNIPIKFAMDPMDVLLDSLKKDRAGAMPHGRLGEWAYNMAVESNNGNELSVENIHFMVDENRNLKDYWRVSNGGKDIIVPECYPRDLLKSVWEEITANEGEVKTKLIDYLRAGKEIPWNNVSDSMWIEYSLKIGKAGVLSDTLLGKNPIKWGDNDTVGDWIQTTQNALARFGLRNADSVKRWMLYASMGIDSKNRAPKLRDQNRKLDILSNFGPKVSNYLQWNKLLFPWDQINPLWY